MSDATATASSQPQPGDGAYLARAPKQPSAAPQQQQQAAQPAPAAPQPGDGAYLMYGGTEGVSRPPRGQGRNGGGRNGRGGGRNGNTNVVANGDAPDMAAIRIDDAAPNGRNRSGRGNPRSNGSAEGEKKRNPRNRNRNTRPTDDAESTALNPSAAVFNPAGLSPAITPPGGHSRSQSVASDGDRRRNGRKGKGRDTPKEVAEAPKQVSNRRAAFERGTKLSGAPKVERPKQELREPSGPEPDDLNSRLTRGLRGKPFIECPICFNPIFSQQQTWSCLPPHSSPVYPTDMDDNEKPAFANSHYTACYTPFHASCIRDWANRSLHEDAERLRLMEKNDEPTWRCPGCQKRRDNKVGGYRCFCSRLANPPTNTAAPHSCADACARSRPNCSHPCPLNCHPGPCPPCQVALVVQCPSHYTPLTVKCAVASTNDAALTPVCDEPCTKTRSCGKHECDKLCHFGPCSPCDEVETVQCYCGADEKVVPCGWEMDAKQMCANEDSTWVGRFACERQCNKDYECGIHKCLQKCHPHSVAPVPCPTSPSVIKTCPCGATPLSALPGYPRADCTAPIPTCGGACPKSRPCGHPCPLKCHSGECPPCHKQVSRPCRCGESVLLLECDDVRERNERGEGEFLCERVCKALRNCGRHECGRLCCPLSYKAKRKGRRNILDHIDIDDDDLHICPLVCGKALSCGKHTCPRPDHKGACGRCLEASYDELICNCGHTVVYPPVACGATVNCVFPCARPAPACGHPKTPHNCHETPECPPCPFLTTKQCACGKDPAVKNVRCSQSRDRVSCGQVCGKLLGCGYHKCEKTCHPGACDSCSQTCNKPKRICRHPCPASCHAPTKCPETDACTVVVAQSCACGNLNARAKCGASAANPTSREGIQLKCNTECAVRQRNARLADALGIKHPIDRSLQEWTPELRVFAKANLQFTKTVETTFRDFIAGTRQTMILPHMPAAKRTFVMSLADTYHIGHELIDAEPNRSVQIRRRLDTRVPNPLLSAAVVPATTRPALGNLGNLRATTGSPSGSGTWAAARAASVPTSRVASPLPSTTPSATPSAAPTTRSSPSVSASAALPPVLAPTATPAAANVPSGLADGTDDWDHDV